MGASDGALQRNRPWITLGAIVVLAVVVFALFRVFDATVSLRRPPPIEALAFERTILEEGSIELHVRNDGADPVEIKQAIVNDAFASFTQNKEEIGRLSGSEVDIQYPWIEGENYEVMLLTATGARSTTRSRPPSRRPTPTSASTA